MSADARKFNNPLDALRYHVTGAVERGEATPIEAVEPIVQRSEAWADAFGVWHASVPLSGSRAKDAHAARKLIQAALEERYAPNYDSRTLHVTRERVTNHGTVIYVEVSR